MDNNQYFNSQANNMVMQNNQPYYQSTMSPRVETPRQNILPQMAQVPYPNQPPQVMNQSPFMPQQTSPMNQSLPAMQSPSLYQTVPTNMMQTITSQVPMQSMNQTPSNNMQIPINASSTMNQVPMPVMNQPPLHNMQPMNHVPVSTPTLNQPLMQPMNHVPVSTPTLNQPLMQPMNHVPVSTPTLNQPLMQSTNQIQYPGSNNMYIPSTIQNQNSVQNNFNSIQPAPQEYCSMQTPITVTQQDGSLYPASNQFNVNPPRVFNENLPQQGKVTPMIIDDENNSHLEQATSQPFKVQNQIDQQINQTIPPITQNQPAFGGEPYNVPNENTEEKKEEPSKFQPGNVLGEYKCSDFPTLFTGPTRYSTAYHQQRKPFTVRGGSGRPTNVKEGRNTQSDKRYELRGGQYYECYNSRTNGLQDNCQKVKCRMSPPGGRRKN